MTRAQDGKPGTRAERRKAWRRAVELLAIRVRFGRRIGWNPHARSALRGWNARDVVVGETHAEAARRTWRKRGYRSFVLAHGDVEAGLMPVTGRFYDEPAFIPEAEGAAYYVNDPRNALRDDRVAASPATDNPAIHALEAPAVVQPVPVMQQTGSERDPTPEPSSEEGA